MNANRTIASRTARSIAFALALMVTLATLGGIDTLAGSSQPAGAQWAQAATAADQV
jgi:hypothetical protein